MGHAPHQPRIIHALLLLLVLLLASSTQGFLSLPASLSASSLLPQRAPLHPTTRSPPSSSSSSSFPLLLFLQTPHSPSRLRLYSSSSSSPNENENEEGTKPNTPDENAAIWGLTDLGNSNFGKFGSDKDPHRNIRPQLMNTQQASWKNEDGADFLPELREIQMRIQGVNVYLVGMPGSGKTTLGRMLAEGLNYRWMDLDQFIEQKLGKSATKVFEEDGEETWRKQETLGMGALQTYVQTVVSTGGGIMQRKENFPFLHSGFIVWLDLPPDGIIARLQASGEIEKRPLLKAAPDPVAVLRELYDARKTNYALADVRVVLRAEDDSIRCLKRLTHRIIEELDLRPPKAKMWEEKRNKMKNLWETMKAKGTTADINEPAEEGGENPTIGAIAALNAEGGKEEGEKKKDGGQGKPQPKKKGFGAAVRKNGGGGGKEAGGKEEGKVVPSAATAAVGSQGVGFGLGLEEYMKGGEEERRKGGEEEQVAEAA